MTKVLVTGSTSGVGRYLTQRLTAQGATVLAHGRDQAKLDALAAETGALTYRADLASLSEVAALAARLRAEHDRIDVLVNNAGVGNGAGHELTADGHLSQWAVNYLAPVLLTRGLLPVLPPGARVVNVGSLGQAPIDFDDLTMEHSYDGTMAYCRSKLALAAWSLDLAERLDKIIVNCIHPATYMDTAMVRQAGIEPWSTVEEGGDAVLRLITDDAGTGRFFNGTDVAEAHEDAYDAKVRRQLDEVTTRALAAFS